MGATRQAISHCYDECLECDYREGHDCTYKKRIKEKCVWYRKKKNGYKLEPPKLTKCPLKDEENEKKMNKKEVLDAISQEFQNALQDIGVTNGEVIKAMFPNGDLHDYDYYDGYVIYELNYQDFRFNKDWWNAPYKAEKEE